MAILAFSVIIATGISNHKTGDYYEKEVSPVALQAVAGAASAEETKLKVWSTDPVQPAVMQSGEFVLEKGNYQITITYSSSNGKNAVELFSKGSVDENNNTGIIIASAEMDIGKNQVIIPVETQQLYQDVSIRILCEQGEILIDKISIRSISPHFTDSLFLMCFILIIASSSYLAYRKRNADWKPLPLFCLAIAVLIMSLPIFNDYLISGHDISYHLGRIDGLYHGLLSGHFPVRINPIHAGGYGTAMPIMYPDLLLYLPALFRLCGVSLMLSYKLFLFLLNAGTVMVSYQCFKRMTASDHIGLIASVLYSLGTYRLVNLYERAALGEAIAMVFLPLVLWAMYEIVFRNKKYWIWAAVGYAMIFQSHIISIFMTVLFTFILLIPCIPRLLKQKDRLVRLLLAGGGALLLSACSLIPFLSYLRLPMKIENFSSNLHQSAVYPVQIFTSAWNGGISGNVNLGSTEKEMPLTIGILLVIGILFFCSSAMRAGKGRIKVIKGWELYA